MVMRVWVLASCGSLLALSACSAEPTTTAQPGSLDASDEDLPSADFPAALDHTPGTAVDIDRALSRPELRPTRSQRAPIPSPARAQRTTLTPEQLRDRVDQIRAQQVQRSRAAGRIPGMAQTRTLPQTSQADVTDVALRPGMVPTATLTITPLTPPPQPTLAPVSPGMSATGNSPTPSAAASVTPQPNPDDGVAVFLGEESTQAVDLGTPESATLARDFPLRSTAHQRDGARHSQDDVVISVAQPPDLAAGAQREILGREASTAHHSPWMTADQAASQVDSQPLFAQAEDQPRTPTDSTNSVLEPEGTALPQPESPATEAAESPATEITAPPQAENVDPGPEVVPPSEPPADLSLRAPGSGLSVPVARAESPHWSALGPEVSVSAVPMALDSPRFADPNAHQRSDIVASATAAAIPEATIEPTAAWSPPAPASLCASPTLAKPLPSDALADSAILEAKDIPAETAAEEIAEEIAVVDCP